MKLPLPDSVWFRHPRIWLTVGALALLFSMLLWVLDRSPPTVIPDSSEVFTVEAGQEVVLKVPVQRSSKRCSVTISRDLVNVNHERSTLISEQRLTAEGRAARMADSPGYIDLRIRIPPSTPSGPAKIVSDNFYTCALNPSTWVWPIEDSWTANLDIRPPTNVVVVPVPVK